MRNFTIILWVGAFLLAAVCFGLSQSLDAAYVPPSQTSTTPYVNLEGYDIYALPDSIAVCKITENGTRLNCLFPPNGSLLLVPKGPTHVRPDST